MTYTCVFIPPPGASEYASQSLVGDQITLPTGSLSSVIRVGQPPAVGITQICGTPVMSDTNAMRFPSGENVGDPARPTFAMRTTSAAVASVDCATANVPTITRIGIMEIRVGRESRRTGHPHSVKAQEL